MRDLLTISNNKKTELSKDNLKLLNRFLNKVKNETYRIDEKNILKLKVFSNVEIDLFLLE